MINMRIGEKVWVRSAIINDSLFYHPGYKERGGKNNHKGIAPSNRFEGIVVYIHPLCRYYTVRYDFPRGSFYESFKWVKR